MIRFLIISFVILLFISCNNCNKKVENHTEVVKVNEDSLRIVNYKDSKKNVKRKKLTLYCWCFGQRPNYGHCKVDFALSAKDVIKKNQIIFSTSNEKVIDSVLYNMVYNSEIVSVHKRGWGDTRLAIKIDYADSSYSTISVSDYGSELVVYNDTVIIEVKFDPVTFLNKITGVKDIECASP